MAKFSQNTDLKQYLLATSTTTLAEASLDPTWGIGLSLRNPNKMDKNKWSGKNWLGNLLMSVRTDIK